MIPVTAAVQKKILTVSMILLLAMGITVLTACPASEQKVTSPITDGGLFLDSATLIGHLAFLTSPATGGRETATPGNLLAQQYIVRKMDSLQLGITGNSRLGAESG